MHNCSAGASPGEVGKRVITPRAARTGAAHSLRSTGPHCHSLLCYKHHSKLKRAFETKISPILISQERTVPGRPAPPPGTRGMTQHKGLEAGAQGLRLWFLGDAPRGVRSAHTWERPWAQPPATSLDLDGPMLQLHLGLQGLGRLQERRGWVCLEGSPQCSEDMPPRIHPQVNVAPLAQDPCSAFLGELLPGTASNKLQVPKSPTPSFSSEDRPCKPPWSVSNRRGAEEGDRGHLTPVPAQAAEEARGSPCV